MLFVVVWYCLAHWLTRSQLGVSPGPNAWPHDLGAHLLIGALLYTMAGSLPRFMIASATLLSAFTFANALKLGVLGGPIMPDDFVSARNLFLLLDGWQLWGSVALLAAPLLLLGWMFAWRAPRAWVALGASVGAAALVVAHPQPTHKYLDARFGDWVWNQPGNFEARGLPIHLVQESARNLARQGQKPDADAVAAALETLGDRPVSPFMRVGTGSLPNRNVHMIVLESFWDPVPLKASRLSADPLDPAFRKLWAAAGHSHILAPVFGGYTANSEFEALCGFPVTQDAVFFEGRLRRDVPCLPGHLGEAGYRSIASHPNAASFWNRVNAYRRIGFEEYWSERNFVLDDMNREFLSDASLYRQVLERLGPDLNGERPVFNYILTYFGHLDYPLNAARPPVIKTRDGNPHVHAYANTVYYKSRELMAFLRELRKRDPNAVIVLFGDHLPFLGIHHGGYTESGLLARNRGEFNDRMYRTLTATPLIVIDGKRGPVKLGDVPLYQLPAIILALLGDSRDTLLTTTASTPDRLGVRPLPGVHFNTQGKKTIACRADDVRKECEASSRWLQAVLTIKQDVFSGDQHALRHLGRDTPGTTVALGEDGARDTRPTR
ncbi:MAG: LTA synthase family protein [Rhodocyclaceae bacterium]